jgi:putative methyltransferase
MDMLLSKALSGGASLKGLCHGKRDAYAVLSSVLARRMQLERALTAAGVEKAESGISHARLLLLAHELLFGRGLRRAAGVDHGFKRAEVADAAKSLQQWQTSLIKAARRRRSASTEDGGTLTEATLKGEPLASPSTAASGALRLPRYARVNTLKAPVISVVRALEVMGYRCVPPRRDGPPAAGELWVDPLVPELLVLPPEGTELHQHSLVRHAVLILQDKASCLSPAALDPPPGSLVVDATAAPGNKSTMLAARCAPGGGRVIACERDPHRARTLEQRASLAASGVVEVVQTDFLSIEPKSAPFCDATHVLLDPSCSGSGMVGQGAPDDEPVSATSAAVAGDTPRLRALASMQLRLLTHALSFQSARVVVYSTCSVHPIENELVVAAALEHPDVARGGWRLEAALPSWPTRGLPVAPGATLCLRAGPEVQTNGFFVARFVK